MQTELSGRFSLGNKI